MAGIDDLLTSLYGMPQPEGAPAAVAPTPQPPAGPALPGPLGKLRDLLNTPVNQVPGKLEQMQLPDGGVRDAANTPLREVPGNVARQVGSAPTALPADSTTTGSDVPGMVAPPKPAGTPPGAPDTLEAIRQVLMDSTDSAPRADTDVPGMIAPQKAGPPPAPQAAPAPGIPHTPFPLGQDMGEGAQAPNVRALISALMNPSHTPPSDGGGLDTSGMGAPPTSGAASSGFEAFLKSLGNPGDEQPPPAGPAAKKDWKANTVTEANPNAEPTLPTPTDTKPAATKVSAGGDSTTPDKEGQSKSLGGALSQGSKGNGSRAGSAVGGVFSSDRKDEENQALHAGLLQFALSALLKPSWGGGSGLWNAINDASDTYNNYGAQRKAERDEVDQRAKNQADLAKSAAETTHLYASADNQRANAGKAKKEGDVLAETKKGDNAAQVTEGMTPGAKLLFEKLTKNLTPEDIVAGKNGKGQYSEALKQAKELDAEEKAQGVTAAQKDSEKQAFTKASAGTLDMATLQKLWPKEIALARTDTTGNKARHLRAYMSKNPTELAKLELALKQ